MEDLQIKIEIYSDVLNNYLTEKQELINKLTCLKKESFKLEAVLEVEQYFQSDKIDSLNKSKFSKQKEINHLQNQIELLNKGILSLKRKISNFKKF